MAIRKDTDDTSVAKRRETSRKSSKRYFEKRVLRLLPILEFFSHLLAVIRNAYGRKIEREHASLNLAFLSRKNRGYGTCAVPEMLNIVRKRLRGELLQHHNLIRSLYMEGTETRF
jgi:hypothetical protein